MGMLKHNIIWVLLYNLGYDGIFIDDIGTEPASIKSWGNEISPVTELLYSRYDRQLFTIITSNLNDKELEERYGLRIADRMAEMFERLHYSNRSYRK